MLYRLLEDFDLTQKVSNYCLKNFHYQSSKHTFKKKILTSFAITIDNASNNKTMVASSEKMLIENGSMFIKQHHVPCMAHVLNLVVQGGLKELGNPSLTSKYS